MKLIREICQQKLRDWDEILSLYINRLLFFALMAPTIQRKKQRETIEDGHHYGYIIRTGLLILISMIIIGTRKSVQTKLTIWY